MDQIYHELFRKASELNEQINKLRDAGEYMCSVHLQDGYMESVNSLATIGLLSDIECSEIEEELKKRTNKDSHPS